MKKSTKIVATIGPATETKEIIKDLILAGMNVARFNTKHGTPQWHQERMKRVKEVAAEMKVAVGILLDLQGPEIRITLPTDDSFGVKPGDRVTFTSDPENKTPKTPFIPQIVVDTLEVGHDISIDDGIGQFEVVEKHADGIVCSAQGTFEVKQRKTLNTPGILIDLPSLIDADLVQLDGANNDLVDFVGLSFVRNAQDIAALRKEMEARKLEADVIAKIENQAAIENFEEILDAADAVMVARGDLAVEVPFQELAFWQKDLIRKSREKAKPVITATQMLKSMVENPVPTRAEVTDVANAIYDGTDAVMLSEETTIGQFPVKAVQTQSKIALFNEQHAHPAPIQTHDSDHSAYITHAAVSLLEISGLKTNKIKIDKIVCLTETGATARNIARFRPHVPVHALTSNQQTYSKMSLIYDVVPHIIELPENTKLEKSEKIVQFIEEKGIAKSGDNILLVHGSLWKKPGLTDTLSILQIP